MQGGHTGILGFRVWVLELRAHVSRFRVEGLEIRVERSRFGHEA